MAGHSHSSNVKYKKSRNDKKRSKDFLKLREKLQSMISNSDDYKKVYSLARESNFPKDKVDLMIKKFIDSKDFYQTNKFNFFRFFKCKFDIFLLVCDNSKELDYHILSNIFVRYFVSEIDIEKHLDIFEEICILKIKVEDKKEFEEMFLSNQDDDFLKGVIEIFEISNDFFNLKIHFSNEKYAKKVLNYFKKIIKEFEIKKHFSPFFPLNLDSVDSIEYFKKLELELLDFSPNSNFFFNTSEYTLKI